MYSRGNQGITGLQGIEQTLNSGLSLPDINIQENESRFGPLNSSNSKHEFKGQQFQTQTHFNKKTKDLVLRSNAPNSDMMAAQAFTSTGTMSETTRRFGQTGYLGFGKASVPPLDALSSGMVISGPTNQVSTINSQEGAMTRFRNKNTDVFGSQQISKSQNRGTALVAH